MDVLRSKFDIGSLLKAVVPKTDLSSISGIVAGGDRIELSMPLIINGTPDESILKALKNEHSSIVSDAVKAISTKSVNAVKFGSGLPIRAI